MTEAVTVTLRTEYESYVSGVSSPRFTWIKGPLNDFVYFYFVFICRISRNLVMDRVMDLHPAILGSAAAGIYMSLMAAGMLSGQN